MKLRVSIGKYRVLLYGGRYCGTYWYVLWYVLVYIIFVMYCIYWQVLVAMVSTHRANVQVLIWFVL